MNDTERTQLTPLVRPPRVVVGVTGSPSSAAAVRLAAAEARRSGRPLVAVLAWEPPGGEVASRMAPNQELDRIGERAALVRLNAALASAFTEAAAFAETPGDPLQDLTQDLQQDLKMERVTVRGPAAPVLTWLADRPDDLLVLGAGARGRLSRLLHGLVRRRALARSCAPVMLVAPPAQPPTLPRSVRRELRRLTPEDFLRPPGLGTAR